MPWLVPHDLDHAAIRALMRDEFGLDFADNDVAKENGFDTVEEFCADLEVPLDWLEEARTELLFENASAAALARFLDTALLPEKCLDAFCQSVDHNECYYEQPMLLWVAPDVDKMRVLLDRGADPDWLGCEDYFRGSSLVTEILIGDGGRILPANNPRRVARTCAAQLLFDYGASVNGHLEGYAKRFKVQWLLQRIGYKLDPWQAVRDAVFYTMPLVWYWREAAAKEALRPTSIGGSFDERADMDLALRGF